MVRDATLADVPDLVAMGGKFIAHSAYAGRLRDDPEARAGLMRRLIENDDGAVFVLEGGRGMIGMIAYRHPISGDLVAGEVFWWCECGRGVELFRAAEAWAIGFGVTAIQMVAPNARVGRLYERLGYAPLESVYQREIA